MKNRRFWIKCTFLILMVMAIPLFGADQLPFLVPNEQTIDVINEAPVETRNFYSEFMYMLFVLGIMIAFLYLASWAMKRIIKTRYQGNNDTSEIKILESRPLSHKAILHIVEIDGQKIIIGESPTQINHIATFPSLSNKD